MTNLNIKLVRLFKFVQEGGSQVNIYVEPTGKNTGQLIISTNTKIFQRYFDGADGGIYDFLRHQTAEAIAYCFESASDRDQKYLVKHLSPVWEQFIETIKDPVV